MLWWKFNGNLTWKVAFLSGFVAFIPLDLVKAIIAAQIVPLFKKLMPEANANTEAKEVTDTGAAADKYRNTDCTEDHP